MKPAVRFASNPFVAEPVRVRFGSCAVPVRAVPVRPGRLSERALPVRGSTGSGSSGSSGSPVRAA